jgi:ABC-type antimicrobial peptide transport system permease subunit
LTLIQSAIDDQVADFGRLVFLISALGSIAVALAVIGIYGVVSSAVRRRTRELGIRIALGAGKNDIYRTVLSSAGGAAVNLSFQQNSPAYFLKRR